MTTLTAGTYERGFRGVWTALVVNLLLAVAASPLLLALGLADDPLDAVPFFAVLSVLPITIIFLLGQRYFIQGIATSGMKG